MIEDQLAGARGIVLALFASMSIMLFVVGAAFGATGSETVGSFCMTVSFIFAVIATILGARNASR